MKTMIIIAALLLSGIAAAYFLGLFRQSKQPVLQNTPTPSPSLSQSSPRPSITPPPSPTVSMSVSPSATPGNTGSTIGDVDFRLLIAGVTGSGFSRTVAAEISNAGKGSAHDVSAKVEVFSGGSRLKVNGQTYLLITVGTLGPGAKITRQVTVEFGVFDGIKVLQNGADIMLTMISDEKTQAFDYSYKP